MQYNGNEEYIFTSYAHRDSATVLPILQALQNDGIRLWYDQEIEAGNEFAQLIYNRITEAQVFLLFLSRAAMEASQCNAELSLALDCKKKILVVYLDGLTPDELRAGLRMRLASCQYLLSHRYADEAAFAKALCDLPMLQSCRDEV